MAKQFSVYNGPQVTTAAPTPVASGTSVKTMIAIATSANGSIQMTEWWWGGDAFAAAAPGTVELMFANNLTTPPTVTAYAAADIKRYDPNSAASLITLGTTASGFTASAEGTPVSPFSAATQQISPTTGFYLQWPYGARPELPVSATLRLRNKFGTTVNVICGIAWEE
jgi:hypothetical protein